MNIEQRWQLYDRIIADGMFAVKHYHIVYTNLAMNQLFSCESGDLVGLHISGLVAKNMRDQVTQTYTNRIAGLPEPKHYELSIQPLDGSDPVEVWMEVEMVDDDDGEKLVVGILRDLRPLNDLRRQLSRTQGQLNSILDNIPDAIYQTNMQGEVTLISPNVYSLLGYEADEMLGRKLAEFYWSPEEREKVVAAIVSNNGVITNVEAILKRKDGSPVWISTNAYVKKNDQGEPVSIEGLARDITVQKELERKLENMSLTDSLTGLPNRRALMDDLHEQFESARANSGHLTLVYFDFNDFKKVNDRFGHLIGDSVLRQLASVIDPMVEDDNIFGRLSGDEFLIILPGQDSDSALNLVNRVLMKIKNEPYRSGSQSIELSISVGISQLRKDDTNEFSILDRADKAMYLSKRGIAAYEVL